MMDIELSFIRVAELIVANQGLAFRQAQQQLFKAYMAKPKLLFRYLPGMGEHIHPGTCGQAVQWLLHR